MYKLNPDCWVWSPRPPLCLHPQHSGRLTSAVLSHHEEEEEVEEVEEEEGEHPAVCCYTTGCDDVISLAADAHWSEPVILSGIPSSSGLAGHGPGARPSQQPKTLTNAGVSQHVTGGHCWEGPVMEAHGCVCVCGQREPESLDPCWSGSPYMYYGVRRNLVVGVEVVEEVAVEDTLELITEDIYTDDLLDPELLPGEQLYPT